LLINDIQSTSVKQVKWKTFLFLKRNAKNALSDNNNRKNHILKS